MSPRFTLRRIGAAVAAAAMTVTIAACGNSSDKAAAPAGDGKPETTALTIGFTPVADQGALIIAVNKGYFTDEGLTVTPRAAQGGAAAVPAMVAGELQGVFGTYPSFLLAQQNATEMRIVGLGVSGSENFAGVFVNPKSGITSIKDLAGKKLAVNTLNNTGDLTIKSVLRENGVDPAQVNFMELPFPDMAGALERGTVDAVWAVEPFQSNLLAAGNKKLFSNFSGRTATIPLAGVAMTADFVKKNPNTTAAFARALERANAELAKDPNSVRAVVPTYSKTTAEVANKMQLPTWHEGYPTVEGLQLWNTVMVDEGALQKPVDLSKMVYAPPAK
ncbi:NitT/TauT family transport system substrate-binding protein [Raineyella antarctica]|uniref:NitT/TauT family transport system substrate-binding protein n=1 Tax=Raineyella antarctica TaxID=1577474 RepID=A0A1G6GH72_9ACTN|nr:ABC transporter substrate-binding protein [Raineyella antarctica]SDB81304.1 NitT/TauT family transport system substrate-binding protein [Raineyella antarctica]